MEEILNAMVGALGSQAVALGEVTDQIRALKMALARKFPELADELKGQMGAEQERSRNDAYELQVSLARVREAIVALPKADAPTPIKGTVSTTQGRASKSANRVVSRAGGKAGMRKSSARSAA